MKQKKPISNHLATLRFTIPWFSIFTPDQRQTRTNLVWSGIFIFRLYLLTTSGMSLATTELKWRSISFYKIQESNLCCCAHKFMPVHVKVCKVLANICTTYSMI